MSSRNPILPSIRAAFLALLCAALPVHANGIAQVQPADASGQGIAESVSDGSTVSINPALDTITLANGMRTTASASVDTTQGIIRGYAGFALDSPVSLNLATDAVGASGSGTLSLLGALAGPGIPQAPGRVNVTVEFRFDGAFLRQAGIPSLTLDGNLSVTRIDSLVPTSGTIYQSHQSFLQTALNNANGSVSSLFEGRQSPLGGGPASGYAGASAQVFSATAADLDAVVRLSFAASVGDMLMISAMAAGTATPEPDPADDATDGRVSVFASAGAVDFRNTGRLSVFLPAGYSLAGSDPLLDNVVFTTPVPEPSAVWLMLAGVVLLGGLMRRRRAG